MLLLLVWGAPLKTGRRESARAPLYRERSLCQDIVRALPFFLEFLPTCLSAEMMESWCDQREWPPELGSLHTRPASHQAHLTPGHFSTPSPLCTYGDMGISQWMARHLKSQGRSFTDKSWRKWIFPSSLLSINNGRRNWLLGYLVYFRDGANKLGHFL